MLNEEIICELKKRNLSLASRIRAENNIGGSSDNAYAFIVTGLKLLFPKISDIRLRDGITDGWNDASIDAVILNKKKKIIFVFNFATEKFKYDEIKYFRDNIDLLLFNQRQSLAGLNNKVKNKIKKIRRYIAGGWKVNIYIIREKQSQVNENVERLISNLKNIYFGMESYFFLDSNLLVKKVLDIKNQQWNYKWSVCVEPGKNSPDKSTDVMLMRDHNNGPIKAMFARIKLKEIIKLQRGFIEREQDLFDANVRDQKRSKKLSSKIIKTIKDNPKHFYIFHNGLTFSCSGIDTINVYNYRIHNPQIINGCQTVSTIYEVYKEKLNDPELKKASILCKFYSLPPMMIVKVCESTNTQLKINLWDLRSNDEIQKILELALGVNGIEYKRKITNIGKNKVFITDLAQWIYSCIYEKPAEAKDKKSNLFDLLLTDSPYFKIFNEKIKLQSIIRICEIAFFIRRMIKKIGKIRLPFGKDADLHFIAAIYKLENKRWSLERKFSSTKRIIETVVREMKHKHGRDLTFNRIFTKKAETWELIQQKINLL